MNLPADIIHEISSWLDNETLCKLSKVGLLPNLSLYATSNEWWHDRIETLIATKFNVPWLEDWREVYWILHRQLQTEQCYYNKEDNITVCMIHRMIGIPIIEWDLNLCAYQSCWHIVYYLLDVGCAPTDLLLEYALRDNEAPVLEKLLQDSRVRISTHSNAIRDVIYNTDVHYTNKFEAQCNVLHLLVADGRLDPSEDSNRYLRQCIKDSRADLVEVLLRNDRVVSKIDTQTLDLAKKYDMLELVLSYL
ncbi:Hypothetical protein POVR2_LOCUS377 [uncultured virus]|nr:Hypothetical protein POVR2_LOCUS377 [uncultured virus]